MKKVLLIFDTSFGNTEQVAREIALGIEDSNGIECTVVNQNDDDNVDYSQYDGILFGGPVHAFRPARGIRKAVDRACKTNLDGKLLSTFDTYQAASHKYKGTSGLEKTLKKKVRAARLFTPGFSALVLGREGPLDDSEPASAREFGKRFAQELG
ncbi:MAG: flavodoxin family protein [Candidatus Thorarchaeota archaeon]